MTMNPALSAFNHVVAFDVSKASLVLHVLPADRQSVAANKPKAIRKALVAEIQRGAEDGLGSMLVVCEATGGYEACGLAICLRTRRRSPSAPMDRAFAPTPGISGRHAKNDPIDAGVDRACTGTRPPILRSTSRRRPEAAGASRLNGTRRDRAQGHDHAETCRTRARRPEGGSRKP